MSGKWKYAILGGFVLSLVIVSLKWLVLGYFAKQPAYEFFVDFLITWTMLTLCDRVYWFFKKK